MSNSTLMHAKIASDTLCGKFKGGMARRKSEHSEIFRGHGEC